MSKSYHLKSLENGYGFIRLRLSGGRPKSFDQLRRLAQSVAHEKITDANGEVMTRVECILRDWSESKDVQKQIAFVQYGYGKPPDKIETNLAAMLFAAIIKELRLSRLLVERFVQVRHDDIGTLRNVKEICEDLDRLPIYHLRL